MTLIEAVELAKSNYYWGAIAFGVIGTILFIVCLVFLIKSFKTQDAEAYVITAVLSGLVTIGCIVGLCFNLSCYENPRASVTDIGGASRNQFSDYHWELVPNKKEEQK